MGWTITFVINKTYECAQAYSKQSNSGDEDDREDDVEHSLNHHSYGKKSVASKGEENITEGLCAIPEPDTDYQCSETWIGIQIGEYPGWIRARVYGRLGHRRLL